MKKNKRDWRKLIIRIGAFIMAAAFVLMLASQIIVYAGAVSQDDIDALTLEQSSLSAQQEELQTELDALNEQESVAVEQYTLLEQQNGVLSDSIETTRTLIAEYDTQITEKNDELVEAEEKKTDYNALYVQRFRAMEEGGIATYWQVIFSSKSFADLLDRLSFISAVIRYDSSVLETLQTAETAVSDAKAALEGAKAAQQTQLDSLAEKQSKIKSNMTKLEAAIAEIQDNQGLYADQMDALEAAAKALEEDIDQERTKLEQEIAAAQAAAEAEEESSNETSNDEHTQPPENDVDQSAESSGEATESQSSVVLAKEDEPAGSQSDAPVAEGEAAESQSDAPTAEEESTESQSGASAAEEESTESQSGAPTAEEDSVQQEGSQVDDSAQAVQEKPSQQATEGGDNVSGSTIVKCSMTFLGNPYRFGGSSLTEGCDGPGFVVEIYKKYGYDLPHSAQSMRSCGVKVNYAEAQLGDIICYNGYVGLYIGDGEMINALSRDSGIVICKVNTNRLMTVRRIL